MRPVWLTLSALLLAGTAGADPADDVRCAEIGFALALEAGNRDRFAAYLDPDARFVGTSISRGPQEILEAWAPFFETGGPKLVWRPEIIEVLEDGKLALSRGPYRLRSMAEDGSPREAWGTFNSIWRRSPDGRWRIVFDAGSAPIEEPTDGARALFDGENHGCSRE